MRLAALALALALPAAAQAESYARAGAAYERARQTGFRDLDCASTAPPALYGCGRSAAGDPLTARGGFGSTAAMEVGLGRRISPWFRVEANLAYRPDLDFRGQANFVRTPGEQRVTADASSLAALGVIYADLGLYGRMRPFLGAGIGAARNRLGSMRFDVPGPVTAPGGRRTNLAWMATAGFSTEVSTRLTVDLGYRYVDLGRMRTAAGPAAPTRASLATQGVAASLRWRL